MPRQRKPPPLAPPTGPLSAAISQARSGREGETAYSPLVLHHLAEEGYDTRAASAILENCLSVPSTRSEETRLMPPARLLPLLL